MRHWSHLFCFKFFCGNRRTGFCGYFVGIEGAVIARILWVSKDLSMRSLDGVQASSSSHTTYQLNDSRKSTSSQNRQRVVLINNSKQLCTEVDFLKPSNTRIV